MYKADGSPFQLPFPLVSRHLEGGRVITSPVAMFIIVLSRIDGWIEDSTGGQHWNYVIDLFETMEFGRRAARVCMRMQQLTTASHIKAAAAAGAAAAAAGAAAAMAADIIHSSFVSRTVFKDCFSSSLYDLLTYIHPSIHSTFHPSIHPSVHSFIVERYTPPTVWQRLFRLPCLIIMTDWCGRASRNIILPWCAFIDSSRIGRCFISRKSFLQR